MKISHIRSVLVVALLAIGTPSLAAFGWPFGKKMVDEAVQVDRESVSKAVQVGEPSIDLLLIEKLFQQAQGLKARIEKISMAPAAYCKIGNDIIISDDIGGRVCRDEILTEISDIIDQMSFVLKDLTDSQIEQICLSLREALTCLKKRRNCVDGQLGRKKATPREQCKKIDALMEKVIRYY